MKGQFTLNLEESFRDDKDLNYFEGKVLAAGKDYEMLSVNRFVDIRKAEACKEKDAVGTVY